jgi:hypothetical protein
MTHLVNLGQPLVKTLVKNPLNTFDPPLSPGTFAAFSKFHLNTSNSPNTKVVYFVEGHNFHVEWHWRFGVEKDEKCKLMPLSTIHWRPENYRLGIAFVHKWLRKRLYTLSRNCRGSRDLQLSLLPLGLLEFNFFLENPSQRRQAELFLALGAPKRRPHRRSHAPAPGTLWSCMLRPSCIRWSVCRAPFSLCVTQARTWLVTHGAPVLAGGRPHRPCRGCASP